jgi:hypothetical protein
VCRHQIREEFTLSVAKIPSWVFETVREMDSNVRGQMETLKQRLAEVLDRESVLDDNLKNIYNVCQIDLKNMTELKKVTVHL